MLHWFHGPIPTATDKYAKRETAREQYRAAVDRLNRVTDREIDEALGKCVKRVPASLDKILDELARRAVEGISDRPSKTGRFPRRAS